MATKNKVREKASGSTTRSRLDAYNIQQIEWRNNVTVILAQQTEILSALREDFKKHESQEEKYQEAVSKFMSDTAVRQAVIDQKGLDQEKVVVKMSENHESLTLLIRSINNKMWFAIGAIAIYAPIIAYMATKLFEHLTLYPLGR